MGDGGERLHEWAFGDDERDETPAGGVYTFVTGGIESALEKARAGAGDKDVTVMGGARTGQQFLAAGLVDKLSLHVVPVLSARARARSRTLVTRTSRSSRWRRSRRRAPRTYGCASPGSQGLPGRRGGKRAWATARWGLCSAQHESARYAQ